MIGDDGTVFLEACKEYGVNSDYIKQTDTKTGHAIIQIDDNAQNCILIYGGANQQLTKEFIDDVINKFDKGDILLLQNEVNDIAYIVDKAYEKGLTIALNPSPYNEKLDTVDMSKISIFLLKEVEGEQITGKKEPDEIIKSLLEYFPEVTRKGAIPSIPCRSEVEY